MVTCTLTCGKVTCILDLPFVKQKLHWLHSSITFANPGKQVHNFRIYFQLFSSAGYNVALYDTVASQLSSALTSIEAQLCDMESKGLMRVDGMTAQKALQLVSSFDDLQKAVDSALYVQVGKSTCRLSRLHFGIYEENFSHNLDNNWWITLYLISKAQGGW